MDDSSRSTLLTDVSLADGRRADVLIRDRVIAAVSNDSAGARPEHGVDVLPLEGYVLLPAPVETHAHLDKALIADRFPNPTFDLAGAISAIRLAYVSMTVDDIEERATRATLMAVAHGCTSIRTHVDCGFDIGTRGVEGLVRVREAMKDVVDIEIVALAGFPVSGSEGAANRRALRAAMAAGADLVGGAPALDLDPELAVRELLAVACETDSGLDVHTDETTDPHVLSLLHLAELVSSTGLSSAVTASHCVSLGMQEVDRARQIADAVAAAGIRVITLPQTNLYLQGRNSATKMPRGLTAIAELRRSGVVVAAGSDNWRDPFNPMGRADPLETATLLVVAGHLSPTDAYATVSEHARTVLGLPPVRIEPGYPADLLAVRARSLADVLASGSEDRLVMKGGRPISRTRVEVEWMGSAKGVHPSSTRSR